MRDSAANALKCRADLVARRAALAGALFGFCALALPGKALQQTQTSRKEAEPQEGTPQQREACTADAMNLCTAFIPDAERIKQCLIQHVNNLSPPCRAVFEHGERPQNQVK